MQFLLIFERITNLDLTKSVGGGGGIRGYVSVEAILEAIYIFCILAAFQNNFDCMSHYFDQKTI
jgi:hypothetical protein